MLLIPAENRISKQNPPILTILIILANVIAFFSLQSNDDDIFYQGIDFYIEEGMLNLEQKALEDYSFEERGDLYDALTNPNIPNEYLVQHILLDQKFAKYVKSRSDYSVEWRKKRDKLESILSEASLFQYAFFPSDPSIFTAFTHMFMHGDIGHLIGNMIFLFLFGYNLELLMGRTKMFTTYILSGLAAVTFFAITTDDKFVPLVGASGAIAGLMGGFAAWYGLRSIRYFYWVFVIFNYVRLPAALVLFYWLAKELVQDSMSSDNVAYMAHFGGLLGGAICVWLLKLIKLNPQATTAVSTQDNPDMDSDEPKQDDLASRMDNHYKQALAATQGLNFELAKTHFYTILHEQPHNKDVLGRLYNLEKASPESSRYATLCADILQASVHNDSLMPLAEQCLNDLKHNGIGFKPIPANILLDFSRKQVRHKKTEPIKPIISLLVQHYCDLEKLPDLLLHFAFASGQNGDWQGKQKVLSFLSKKYPDTFAGQEAKKALQES
ncbi:rhomboid family intramembrane serine protease [Kangiella koreensis]|uniref:Rhomboid family protein n=1 Tax=Kangiella koreensis (strain DSM 16069 / JCM 12317 / KCTC 12182 / SW-125) TaxID=523791 RepID=C7R9C8_KANKD|nr:rhomboid family intramembrane serine protease [Kangiella koreensis]ACV26019.1 Rhomboid family protein [Kangiella koreensis DSM 16069]